MTELQATELINAIQAIWSVLVIIAGLMAVAVIPHVFGGRKA